MRLDRIAYQYPDGTVAGYDFHPRLTVIDVHPAHRSALVHHLATALSSSAPGVHVEVTFATGGAVVAFRPYGAPHRVIDLDSSEDTTATYEDGQGSVDLLRPLGVDLGRLTATAIAGKADLTIVDPTEVWISRLASHDADALMGAAHRAAAAERELRAATAATRATPEDAAAIDGALGHREATTALERRHNKVRAATLVIGLAVPIAAVAGLDTIGVGPALGLIGATIGVAVGCGLYERKLAKAVDAEYEALAAAGSANYTELDARVEGTPLADRDLRARLIDAAENYRVATASWQGLAGDIPAPWALTQESRLRDTAALRSALQPIPLNEPQAGQTTSAAMLTGLMNRSTTLGDLAPQEPLPLFLDDPFGSLSWDDKVPVLEFLGRLSERQQLVLATDDIDVLSWARLEEMTGGVAVIDVNPGRAAASKADATTGRA